MFADNKTVYLNNIKLKLNTDMYRRCVLSSYSYKRRYLYDSDLKIGLIIGNERPAYNC